MSSRHTASSGGHRRESVFTSVAGDVGGAAFFPLLQDSAAAANEKERLYYAREEEKIHQTVEQMEQCQTITEQMLEILNSFDEKLSSLESQMLPIHKGTQALTTAQKNIDSTLRETDKIILHYSIATESEESINGHLINSVDYVSYLEWVEKIHHSINFFATNKDRLQGTSTDAVPSGVSTAATAASSSQSHSSEFEKYLKRLKELNKRVMGECENEFERVLNASSKQPLDLSRTGWPLAGSVSETGHFQPFQVVPQLSVKELSLLATRMAWANNHNYFGVLLAQRSAFIRASLKKIFHEEVRFVVNASASAPAPAPGTMQVMHMRGSIIHTATSGGGGGGMMSFGSNGALEPPTPTAWTSGGGVIGGGSSAQLYRKNSHRSVFYLDFFLKLLELENAFLMQTLAHVFRPEDLRTHGLHSAAEDTSASQKVLAAAGSGLHAMSSMSLTALGVSTSVATGSLTVFWGQEAYDQIFANIVEAPIEYFKKKIEQNTYLKESAIKFSSVFNIGKESAHAHPSQSTSNAGASTTAHSSAALSTGSQLSNKILILLDVLEHLNALLPRYRIILKKHTQFEKMTDFQQQVTSLARKSIQEYREYLLDYQEKTATKAAKGAKDGTIYTLTVETLNFLKRLYEYRGVIEHTTTLVDKHHQGQQAQAEKDREKERAAGGGGYGIDDRFGSGPPPEESASPLTRLVSFLLSALESNMEQKSRSLKLASLSAIFLLNNFHYASRFLKKNDAIFFQPGPGNLQSALDRYDRLVHATMKQYRTVSWEKIVAQALEPSELVDLYRSYKSAAPNSSAHKAARKAIKHKFAFFNTSFDELYHSQRYFAIPDSDLRSQLRNDNVELIMQGYKQLYDTFTPVNFSTNPAKYMKYQPHTVEKMINQFFDETTA